MKRESTIYSSNFASTGTGRDAQCHPNRLYFGATDLQHGIAILKLNEQVSWARPLALTQWITQLGFGRQRMPLEEESNVAQLQLIRLQLLNCYEQIMLKYNPWTAFCSVRKLLEFFKDYSTFIL